jgi:hypothetical protein
MKEEEEWDEINIREFTKLMEQHERKKPGNLLPKNSKP